MSVYTWGRGEDGQLGHGDTQDRPSPALVESLQGKAIVQMACGSGHTIVLSRDGQVYTWGRGDDGRLGHGDNGWQYVPRLLERLSNRSVVQVACGSYHTAAVTSTGELLTWGGGMYGKLGHGNELGHSVPYQVESLRHTNLIQVACGSRHTVALDGDGKVYTWGDRESGVCGHAELGGHEYLPRLVETLHHVVVKQIAACGFHTAVLNSSGEIFTWGEGKFGRLGHGTERSQPTPRPMELADGLKMKQVACGGFHTAAISENGQVYTWGGGEHGQLGHADRLNKLVPTWVEALSSAAMEKITCGWSHTASLDVEGRVYAWGNGDHGKLGRGDNVKVTVPLPVESLSQIRVSHIASYNEHTAILTSPDHMTGNALVSRPFLKDLNCLIGDETFSDVTLVVENHPIHTHRAILAARSRHFRAMFQSGMRESTAKEIVMEGVRLPIFRLVLEFLYTDNVEITQDTVIELYMAADMLQLDSLKALCEMTVSKTITDDNAAALLKLADDLGAPAMKEICFNYIIREFDVISKSSAFEELSRDLILQVLRRR